MLVGRKSLALLLAFAIATTQLLFSCQSAMANLIPSPHAKMHGGCEHCSPKPTPTDSTCPHCNGTAAVMSAFTIEPAHSTLAASQFVAIPIEQLVPTGFASQTPARPTFLTTPATLPITTLFGMHCAQQI